MTKKELYTEIGERVRSIRKSMGLSQQELADSVGLTRTSITNFEQGRQHISLHSLQAIADRMGEHINSLLPGLPPPDSGEVVVEGTNNGPTVVGEIDDGPRLLDRNYYDPLLPLTAAGDDSMPFDHDYAHEESRKPTRSDFNHFRKRFKHWHHILGLDSWSVYYSFDSKHSGRDVRAVVHWNTDDHICTVCLNPDAEEWPDDEGARLTALGRTAFHEAFHLVLADLDGLAKRRFCLREEDIDKEQEKILRTVESMLSKLGAVEW